MILKTPNPNDKNKNKKVGSLKFKSNSKFRVCGESKPQDYRLMSVAKRRRLTKA